MASITRFITTTLNLKVNEQKSAVARPWERKFLAFSLTAGWETKRRIAPKVVPRFKEKIRELTSRKRGISMERMAEDLTGVSGVGLAISASAKRRRCCEALRSGQGAGCGLRSGSSGREARGDLPNCRNGEWAVTLPPKRQAAPMARGGWRTRRRYTLDYPMPASKRLGFQD